MNATNLKIIAVICMTLDHLSTYLGAPLPLRYIGRIAAVIFFFCAAESAVHTHDRKKYLLRLYAMSLLMTALSVVVPFILNGWFSTGKYFFPPTNNIFTELLPGVWIIDILDSTKNDPKKRKKRFRNFILYQLATIPIGVVCELTLGDRLHLPEQVYMWPLGSLFMSEGNIWLTLLIPLFYCWRGSKKKLTAGYLTYCILYTLITVPQLPAHIFRFTNAHVPQLAMTVNNIFSVLGFEAMQGVVPLRESLLQYNFQCFMILALPLLLLYNGERGKGHKRFFYVYYPAHIYLLYLAQQFI